MTKKIKTKDKSSGTIIRRLLEDAKRIKWGILASTILAAMIIACNTYSPYVMGDIVDEINRYFACKTAGVEVFDIFATTKTNMIILIAVYIAVVVFGYLKMFTLNNVVSRHFTCAVRIDLGAKLIRVPVSFIDRTQPGEFLSRMTDDVSNMGNTVHTVLDTLTLGFIQILSISIIMFLLSPLLAVVVLVLVPISIFASSRLAKKAENGWDEMFMIGGKIQSQLEESLSGYTTIKVYNMEESQTAKFEDKAEKGRIAQYSSSIKQMMVNPIISIVNNFAYILICLIGGYLAIKDSLNLGVVVSIILYAKLLSTPLGQIAEGFSGLQRVKASAKRVYEIMDEKELSVQKGVLPEKTMGDVVFSHVEFSYNESTPLITDLNFAVHRGQKVAIVGPTGAGKTTIVNLLMRFYDIQKGSITLDGVDINRISRENLRTKISMVLQDTWLMSGTVFENVSYGKDNATMEEVKSACESALCDRYIRGLPDGYNTKINESTTNISGGQKQLLTIARAFLNDRPLLILDEATSNVDTRTELLIQEAMDKLMKDKTCFIIAHRLSTIVNADIILVMDKGDIIEVGTHKELMEKGGFYSQLYNSQYAI